MTITLQQGNALDAGLEDESVDVVVTSPPYYNLRAYAGTEQVQVWDGDPNCQHVWGSEVQTSPQTGGKTEKQITNMGSYHDGRVVP